MSLKSYLEYEMHQRSWTIPMLAAQMTELNARYFYVRTAVKDPHGNITKEEKPAVFSYQQAKRLLNYSSPSRLPREGTTLLLAALFNITTEEFEKRCRSNIYDNATLENNNSEIRAINIVKYIEHHKKLDSKDKNIDYHSEVYDRLREIDLANGVSECDLGEAQSWIQIMRDFPQSTTLLVDSALQIVGDISIVFVNDHHSIKNDNDIHGENLLPMDIPGGNYQAHILSLQVEASHANNQLLVDKLLEVVLTMAESGLFLKSLSIRANKSNYQVLNWLNFRKIDSSPLTEGSLYFLEEFSTSLQDLISREPTGRISDLLTRLQSLYSSNKKSSTY